MQTAVRMRRWQLIGAPFVLPRRRRWKARGGGGRRDEKEVEGARRRWKARREGGGRREEAVEGGGLTRRADHPARVSRRARGTPSPSSGAPTVASTGGPCSRCRARGEIPPSPDPSLRCTSVLRPSARRRATSWRGAARWAGAARARRSRGSGGRAEADST